MPRNGHFWQVSLLHIVFSEYLDKSRDFRNFVLDFSTLSEVEDKALVDTLPYTLAKVKENTIA